MDRVTQPVHASYGMLSQWEPVRARSRSGCGPSLVFSCSSVFKYTLEMVDRMGREHFRYRCRRGIDRES